MGLKRILLLILGITGSFMAGGVLYISAENAQTVQPPPEFLPQPIPTSVKLPMGVPGTAMIAQRISAYDGPFLEDGSDREVFGVAALLVYNGGSKELLHAQIKLEYPDVAYMFAGSHIPPGKWVMLLEKNAMPYREDAPTACTGSQTVSLCDEKLSEEIKIEDTVKGMLIHNFGRTQLENVCIYYKTWLESPGLYIGGITYCTVIPRLQPGESIQLQPYHYAPGYSKVVSVVN